MSFLFFRVYKKNDDTSNYYYLYEELDIIPATVMYYETDFADGVFTLTDGAANKWSTKQDTGYKEDEVQDDGTIGMNQTYGFDSTYTDDAVYSNGTSLMVEGEKNSDKVVVTKAGFSFTGTGFDLISRTGAKQGLIQVKIYASNNAANPVKTVKVLNKSESNLELYQIPVVSVNDLDYGTYNVTIDVYEQINSYTGNMASLNRGGEFYFDIYGNIVASSTNNSLGQTTTEAIKAISEGGSSDIMMGDGEDGTAYFAIVQRLGFDEKFLYGASDEAEAMFKYPYVGASTNSVSYMVYNDVLEAYKQNMRIEPYDARVYKLVRYKSVY